jgi:hypothetical protein
VSGADLLAIMREGFSADRLRTLSDHCPQSDAARTHPTALLVLEHIGSTLAARWEGRAVTVGELEHGRSTLEEPILQLLQAMVRGDPTEVMESTEQLSRAFIQFRA